MKKIKVESVQQIDGKDFKDATGEVLGLPILLKMLAFNIPTKELSMQDSIEAGRLLKAIGENTNGVLALEDGVYDWVKKIVDRYAPLIFGVNAVAIRDAVENIEKAHEPKG